MGAHWNTQNTSKYITMCIVMYFDVFCVFQWAPITILPPLPLPPPVLCLLFIFQQCAKKRQSVGENRMVLAIPPLHRRHSLLYSDKPAGGEGFKKKDTKKKKKYKKKEKYKNTNYPGVVLFKVPFFLLQIFFPFSSLQLGVPASCEKNCVPKKRNICSWGSFDHQIGEGTYCPYWSPRGYVFYTFFSASLWVY